MNVLVYDPESPRETYCHHSRGGCEGFRAGFDAKGGLCRTRVAKALREGRAVLVNAGEAAERFAEVREALDSPGQAALAEALGTLHGRFYH